MSKFKPRDKVKVIEVDEWDEECGIKVGMKGVVVKELERSGFICINFHTALRRCLNRNHCYIVISAKNFIT